MEPFSDGSPIKAEPIDADGLNLLFQLFSDELQHQSLVRLVHWQPQPRIVAALAHPFMCGHERALWATA